MVDDASGEVVGTYRVQPGTVAAKELGFYSAQEFEFAPYEHLTPRIVELGRACILRQFRSYEVLALLWRAVAIYATRNNARYLLGCSSVTSQDPAVGWALYERLRPREVTPELTTVPTPSYELPWCAERDMCARIPKLLRGYLAVGAKICGPPALDRQFKTLDFLTLLDIQAMSPTARSHFFHGV
jgi:putative hemolysin